MGGSECRPFYFLCHFSRKQGSMSILLAVDIGTTKLCALALDASSGNPLAILTCPNDSEIPGLERDQHEQDPRRILMLSYGLLQDLLKQEPLRGQAVAGLGLTGQMHGVLLVDEQLEPLTNLITWRDARSAADISFWQERIGMDAPARLGCLLAAGYGGPSLAWLARKSSLPANARALSIAGFLAASLCGEAACDPTHAASWGLYDVLSGGWDLPTAAALGIDPHILPALQPAAMPLGYLSGAARKRLGLPSGIPVCSPLGDNQAGVYGLANGDRSALMLNLGTGGQVSTPRSTYAYNPALETRPMPFGGFIQVGASLCGGWSYAYLRQFFQAILREIGGIELPDEMVYARMNDLAEQAESEGLVFDTRFNGSRLEPGLRGSLSGIDSHNLTPAALSRSLVAGMLQELFDLAQAAGLQDVRRVVAAGNAVRKNPLLPQLIARRFGLPCEISEHREEAALGAARAALDGLRSAQRLA
jgi:sugar (pentulose or hexulose) kinase